MTHEEFLDKWFIQDPISYSSFYTRAADMKADLDIICLSHNPSEPTKNAHIEAERLRDALSLIANTNAVSEDAALRMRDIAINALKER